MHFIRSPPPRNCVKNAIIQNPRSYRDYAPADPVFLYGSLASIKMTIHTYFKLYSNYWFIDGAQMNAVVIQQSEYIQYHGLQWRGRYTSNKIPFFVNNLLLFLFCFQTNNIYKY